MIIDHMTLGSADFARATEFYTAALAPLGITRLFDVPLAHSGGILVTGYGRDRPQFWLAGERATTGLMHIAFAAPDHAAVDAFYAAALAAGGTDNGAPGPRPHYHAEYYGAFILDPDGHNIEAVCHGAVA